MPGILKLTKVHAEGISICEIARRKMVELQRSEPTFRVLDDEVQTDGPHRLGGRYPTDQYLSCTSNKSDWRRMGDKEERTSSDFIRPKLCRSQPDPLQISQSLNRAKVLPWPDHGLASPHFVGERAFSSDQRVVGL